MKYLSILGLGILLVFAPTLFADDSGCVACHQKEQAAEEHAIHQQEGVGCVDCHGGDSSKSDRGAAHSGNFRGRIAREGIPEFCGSCHSDVRKMNPFGIATDQESQYLTSKHGEALQKGKTDVATCIDCHSTHGILKVKDPRSPVFPKNVPTTCGRCHGDSTLMERHGLPATAVELYLQSIHADLLLKKDDLSAPTCATCHGNHGATPPGFSEIRLVCGKCHVRQQELFAESPHAPLSEGGFFESCVTCHSNHKILRKVEDIKMQCAQCHEAGDDAMKRRDRIFAVIQETETEYDHTEKRLTDMTRAGFHTEEEQVMLEQAKTALLQLPPIQHTLDPEKVQKTADESGEKLTDLNLRMDQLQKMERWKKLALIPIWLFLICMSAVFWAKRKQLEEDEEEGETKGGDHE